MSVAVEHSSRPTAGDPESTEDQGDRDGQVSVLDAQVLAPLYTSVDRRFRMLERIHKQSLDMAGGEHLGKDDLDVGAGDQSIRLKYASDGTGKTEVRILMVGLEAAGKTTILLELKLGEIVTTIATIGFNVEDVRGQDIWFHRVGRQGPGQVPPSVASLLPGNEQSDLRCRQ